MAEKNAKNNTSTAAFDIGVGAARQELQRGAGGQQHHRSARRVTPPPPPMDVNLASMESYDMGMLTPGSAGSTSHSLSRLILDSRLYTTSPSTSGEEIHEQHQNVEDDIDEYDDDHDYDPSMRSIGDSHQDHEAMSISPYYYEVDEPHESYRSNGSRRSNSNQQTFFRRVRRVSRYAAYQAKQAVWDSNDAPIGAALSAVDHWESAYITFRRLAGASVHSAQHLYGAAKQGLSQLEIGFIAPVRDWILWPALQGMEHVTRETVAFAQGPRARELAQETLEWARQVPVLGENVLAPGLVLSVGLVERTWQIMQYPIPSRHRVSQGVDVALNGAKWALSVFMHETHLYLQRADANLSRTLSHTRWTVLGSGPYETLNKSNQEAVMDHVCERYFALTSVMARYELAAHIRLHNPVLYYDLINTGLLLARAAPHIQEEDVWLQPHPIYRAPFDDEHDLEGPFLTRATHGNDGTENYQRFALPIPCALWFRLPNFNGEPPSNKDTPWICFRQEEQVALEEKFHQMLMEEYTTTNTDTPEKSTREQRQDATPTNPSAVAGDQADIGLTQNASKSSASSAASSTTSSPYPTIAKWYTLDLEHDVLVDQQRHAVTLQYACQRCRKTLSTKNQPPFQPTHFNEVCRDCNYLKDGRSVAQASLALLPMPPPMTAVMRPTLWRFYGKGDEVRRGAWLLDTPRAGLQPFDDVAQAVLEDAYQFLRYLSLRQRLVREECTKKADQPGQQALLTVQVPCPDGKDRLVQFSSLTHATAIQKGILPSMALFKQRVYRGAWLIPSEDGGDAARAAAKAFRDGMEASLVRSVQERGVLGDTMVPNTSLREALTPPSVYDGMGNEPNIPPLSSLRSTTASSRRDRNSKTTRRSTSSMSYSSHGSGLLSGGVRDGSMLGTGLGRYLAETPDFRNQWVETNSLAAPPARLAKDDMSRHLANQKKRGEVDHLVLVVHGIGEMMRSSDVFGLNIPSLSSLIECVGFLRRNHEQVAQEALDESQHSSRKHSARYGSVEFLPVEWHESFAIISQRRRAPGGTRGGASNAVMLKDITLRTIPQMRDFANESIMDVLFYMNPEHHDIMVEMVTLECNAVVSRFRRVSGFQGRVSIMAHSLGSIITWDILSQQQPIPATPMQQPSPMAEATLPRRENTPLNSNNDSLPERPPNSSSSDLVSWERSDTPEVTSTPPGPEVTKRSQQPQLEFPVDNFFILGSPLAVILMIRNQREPIPKDFSLPGCPRVLSVFHPYDPVAYRMEPCIDANNACFEPTIIKHWNGGFRVHYQTKRLWKRFMENTFKTQIHVVDALEGGLEGIGLLNRSINNVVDDDNASEVSSVDNRPTRVVTGQLNQGRRIDFMLQEKELESANEYVAALAAHSSYWIEKDLSLFVARQIYLSTHEIAEEEEEEGAK